MGRPPHPPRTAQDMTETKVNGIEPNNVQSNQTSRISGEFDAKEERNQWPIFWLMRGTRSSCFTNS